VPGTLEDLCERWDRPTRARLGPILDAALPSVRSLAQLDDVLDAYFANYGGNVLHGEKPRPELERIATESLTDLRRLLPLLEDAASEEKAGAPAFDFSFEGDSQLDDANDDNDDQIGGLNTMDITTALGGLGRASNTPQSDRLQKLRPQLSAIGYALRTQLERFDERFVAALNEGSYSLAITELDHVSGGLIDGLFALVTVLFKPFVEDFELSEYLPGHQNSLDKALMIRRRLADLRSKVSPLNDRVQNKRLAMKMRENAIERIVREVRAFVEAPDFRVLRPDERWEMKRLAQTLAVGGPESFTTCEGFARFLESMKLVNQRDVVSVHDRHAMDELAGLLEAAQPLLSISVQAAQRMIAEAVEVAFKLYGLSDPLDDSLRRWKNVRPVLTSPMQTKEVMRVLSAVLVR